MHTRHAADVKLGSQSCKHGWQVFELRGFGLFTGLIVHNPVFTSFIGQLMNYLKRPK